MYVFSKKCKAVPKSKHLIYNEKMKSIQKLHPLQMTGAIMENKTVDNQQEHEHELAVANARFSTESVLNSSRTIKAFSGERLDDLTLLEQLHKQVEKAAHGDMSRSELMLMTQAQTLDAIFHKMMTMAMSAEFLTQLQAYSDLGFKAQNQCRKALLAHAEIKTPKRATFIKQQNNAVNQQVNNDVGSENLKKTKNITNELLSEVAHEALDDRRKSQASNIDSPVETMAESGGENRRRKGSQPNERI